MPADFRYSRWDGTQAGFDIGAQGLLSELTDDLIYHGDLNAALRRLLAEGMRTSDGERLAGLRELIERLRQRRREELERGEIGGAFAQIARELRDIVDEERAGIDRAEGDAIRSGEERRRQTAEAAAAERRVQLDLLPSDLAGQVRELSNYDFASAEAQKRFDDLVDRLRRELLQSRFNEMTGAMSSVGPEQLQRTKDMLAALNQMLDQRAQGIEPDFAAFMASYGDFFPENPQTLDELLKQLAAQMAAFQSFLNSLSAEQRAELARLSDELLGDMDLRWQLDQLSRNLQAQTPELGWGNSYDSSGQGPSGPLSGAQSPLSLLDAVDLVDRLGQIDALEGLLSGAASPGALLEVDAEVARHLLGDDGARSLDRLAELARSLTEAGLIEQREGRLEMTPRGLRRLGENALTDLFARLGPNRLGHHPHDREGPGHERSYDTKPYEFGDPFNLNIERTIRNSLLRTSHRGERVSLHPDDFEVERTETLTRASTVLAIDLSLSMPMRDNFLAAKKTAIALHSLISGRYPSDYLGIVGFSEVARALRPEQLPEVSWDFVFGTNMQHALLLARRMLAGRPGSRQVMMITDGEPTAHITADGEPLFHYPPTRETVEATLTEVTRCTREGIRINTFMLDATPHLQEFVEKLTRINRGRVFFTTPDTLGDYVLVDFIDQKRSRRRSA